MRGQLGELKYIGVKGTQQLLRGICKHRGLLGEKFPVAHSDLGNFDESAEIQLAMRVVGTMMRKGEGFQTGGKMCSVVEMGMPPCSSVGSE